MRLARQSVGYRVDLKEGELFYQAFMRSHIRLTLNHLTYRNPSNSLTEYLDSVASSGIEPLQGDSRFSSLHVDRLPGVVPLVDDDVLVLLRGDVRFPRYIEAAGDRGNVFDDRRRGILKSVQSFCYVRETLSLLRAMLRTRWMEFVMRR